MKFSELPPGADPSIFSSAVVAQDHSAEQLRRDSLATIDPFMPPQYSEQPTVRTPEPTLPETTTNNPEGDKEVNERDHVRIVELGWEILPPEELGPRGPIGSGGAGHESAADTTEPADDHPVHSRILRSLIASWSEGYVAVKELGNTRYEVAIRPVMVGNIAVENAVGDTTEPENGLYAFLGANGIVDGEVVTTWTDVFHEGKSQAKDLGARKFNHTDTLEERLRAYLDQPFDAK